MGFQLGSLRMGRESRQPRQAEETPDLKCPWSTAKMRMTSFMKVKNVPKPNEKRLKSP